MADNPPEQPPKKAQPPLPSSGTTGRLKAPTTKLPPMQATATGKVVVMLSSVAKPTNSQKILPPPNIPATTPVVTGPMVTPPRIAPPLMPATGNVVRQPPPLPAKKPMPVAAPLPPEQRLSTTTFVKLPPKTSVPAFVSLVPRIVGTPEKAEPTKIAAPLLPPKRTDPPAKPPEAIRQADPAPAKSDKKKTGIIKLNTPAGDKPAAGIAATPKPDDSIFADIPEPAAPPVPEGWSKLHTGELPLPPGGIKDNDPFQQSRRMEPAPTAKSVATPVPVPVVENKPADKPVAAPTPAPIAQDKPATASPSAAPHAPPLAVAEPITAKSAPTLNPAPVDLPSAHPVHVAPPLVEKGHEEAPTKLPVPHAPETTPSAPVVPKAPELKSALPPAPTEPPRTAATPPPLPVAKPKDKEKEKLKKTGPIVLATTTRIPIPGVGEQKPSLRPAVLPSRMRTAAEIAAASTAAAAVAAAAAAAEAAEITAKAAPVAVPVTKPLPVAKEPVVKAEPPKESPAPAKTPAQDSAQLPPVLPASGEKAAAATAAVGAAAGAGALASVAAVKKTAPALPPTRVERAKKRRLRGVIAFWILVPIVALALFLGILYFGRDTRVEGQIIPPEGMSLADEVWIVSDFSSLAAGVADDVARERVPLQLAIQEAQDHVQRVQADIASREERIRLITDNIQAAKDDITNTVKKSQTDSQAIYDNQGKELDDEYNSRMAGLKQAIADRAASLKLQYTPDPAFPSPEVWANAYRLALYETPPGVDGVKEHQWIADQMKQWRDFEKSMDDRYQQMRAQAADLKQANGPHIADLNTKIDDLNSRIQATETEEDPLKAELIAAQKDLGDAQATESGLDDKYYGQLNALPAENISYHIPLQPNGRFTWVPDNPFGEGEIEHHFILFSRAVRADGRQYWALHEFTMKKNETTEVTLEPTGYESTKQILRPNLSPDEIEQ